MTPKDIEQVAKAIQEGRSAHLLEELTTACRPYLRKVLHVKGFGELSQPDRMDELVADAVRRSLAEWDNRRCRFIMKLRSTFLHACRYEMRMRRGRPLIDLQTRFGPEADPWEAIPQQRAPSPDAPVTKRELADIVRDAMLLESKTSRTVVTEYYRGASHAEIADCLGITPLRSAAPASSTA